MTVNTPWSSLVFMELQKLANDCSNLLQYKSLLYRDAKIPLIEVLLLLWCPDPE